jgi:hypothetical protein
MSYGPQVYRRLPLEGPGIVMSNAVLRHYEVVYGKDWRYAEVLRLEVPGGAHPGGFQCKDIPHFAVALAPLDVCVRIDDGRGLVEVEDGRAYGVDGDAREFREGPHAMEGETITFLCLGPDAKKALGHIRLTFYMGRRDHLATIREWTRIEARGGLRKGA